jgi:hypothetical protein
MSLFIFTPSFGEKFEIILRQGWNAISIPYETFVVQRVDREIYPTGFIYNPVTNNYNPIQLSSLSSQLGAMWVYSFKEGSKIVIDGGTL